MTTELSCGEYLDAVDDYLEKHYGVVSEDDWRDEMISAEEAGDTPKECAEWLASQYNLLPTE